MLYVVIRIRLGRGVVLRLRLQQNHSAELLACVMVQPQQSRLLPIAKGAQYVILREIAAVGNAADRAPVGTRIHAAQQTQIDFDKRTVCHRHIVVDK